MLAQFFQMTPIPLDQVSGTYNIPLVVLSYLVATLASYVALDITNRLRDVGLSKLERYLWLIGGSFAMGIGIWSMHFIGMLAFIMPMPMLYDPALTVLSMVIAVIASSFAFFLLKSSTTKLPSLILGGVVLGFAISAMHYTGMEAMAISMHIRYLPVLFACSILIGIVASEAALYLAIMSARVNIKHHFSLKAGSAFIMGAGICGMHYTGMAAAVFTPLPMMSTMVTGEDPASLSVMIALATIFLLGIAIVASSLKKTFSAKSLEMARQSGMAEVASNVLHDVGNVLNSVNISASLMKEHLKKLDVAKLADVNRLIDEHRHDLAAFIDSDPAGSRLPGYLVLLNEQWQQAHLALHHELKQLKENIQHIKQIISVQQSMGKIISFSERLSIDRLLDDALRLSGIAFSKHGVIVKKEYAKLKPVCVDKLKLTQVVVNVLCNAKEALSEVTNQEKIIRIKTSMAGDDSFLIQVIDNGIGINMVDKVQIFSHGFTTKEKGHGFGLHASALAIHEMQGSLTVASEGLNKGATFTIKLPL